MKRATINDVADAAGVSIKTVSRVFNGEPNVRSATAEKVREAAERLQYSPNLSARRLAANRSFLIGLVYDNPEGTNSFIPDVQSGVLDACQHANYELIIHPGRADDSSAVADLLRMADKLALDGLILLPPFSDDAGLLEALVDKGIRFSRISQSFPDRSEPCVSGDDVDAAISVTRYLIGLGHKEIGFVKGHRDHGASQDRYDGFTAALKEAGIPLNESWVVEGDFSFVSGLKAGEQLLSGRRPTAIFASNDDMAAGVMAQAHRLGIAVPSQLSICGYDDVSIASQVWPALTTVRQPIREIARTAALHLFSHIGNMVEGDPLPTRFHSQLLVRDSTGPAPA